MFRGVLTKCDGVIALLRRPSTENAVVVARSCMEESFGLDYLLRNDSERRAYCYWYWHLKEQEGALIKASKREGLGDLPEFHGGPAPNLPDGLDAALKAKSAGLYESMKAARFGGIREEYKGLGRHPKWYSAFGGPKNIAKLADHLGRSEEYFLYGIFSAEVHGSTAMSGIVDIGDGTSSFRALSNPKGSQLPASICASATFHSLQTFVSKLATDQAEPLRQWYVESWRQDYHRLSGN